MCEVHLLRSLECVGRRTHAYYRMMLWSKRKDWEQSYSDICQQKVEVLPWYRHTSGEMEDTLEELTSQIGMWFINRYLVKYQNHYRAKLA